MAHSMILPQDKDDDDAVFRSRTGSKDKADGRGAHSVFSFLTATARANDRFDVFDDDIDEEDVYEDEGDDEDDATETFSGDEDGTRHRKSTQSAESNESTESTREDSHLLRSNISANHDYDYDTDEIVPLEQSHSHLANSVHSMVMSKQALGSKSKGTEPEAHTRQIHHRAQESRAHALTDKLRKQLGISEDDALIGDYPCWLLKNILLQGHLYLTTQHTCFFAYLPHDSSITIKTGSLSKKSRKTRAFFRYWFVLRNDCFSYYINATDLYFPAGTIDLRYAIKAEISGSGDKSKSSTFTILTEQKTYTFRADSYKAAHEWVKALEKEIFRSRNEGDCVKVLIPMANIIDLEESSILDLAVTLKIRAIDGDETYAVDDYVLAFFHKAEEVVAAIKQSMKEMGVPRIAIDDNDRDLAASSPPIEHAIVDSTEALSSRGRRSPKMGSPLLDRTSSALASLASSTIKRTLTPQASLRDLSVKVTPQASLRDLSVKVKGLFADDSGMPPSIPRASTPDALSVAAADSTMKASKRGSDSDDNYDVVSSSDSAHNIQFEGDRRKKKPVYPFQVVSKVTEMWGGGRKHFRYPDEGGGIRDDHHLVSDEDGQESNERFRSHFPIGDADNLVATYFCHIQKAFPIYGKMYLSNNHLCYRSLIPGTSTKMILPLGDIENVTKEKGFRFGYSGLVIVIHGHEEIFFEFGVAANRDDCEIMILRELDRYKKRTIKLESSDDLPLRMARLCTYEDALKDKIDMPPMMLDHTLSELEAPEYFCRKPLESKHFTLLTIGSRGDVQPYIALGKALIKEGHRVRIATHAEFQPWIEKHGIEFREVAGDPAALMKIMIEHGMFSMTFIKEAKARFRNWIDELLSTAWEACQGTDILIESPSAMAGIHIAEALKIPYFRAFTMPWTRTRAYPHAFIVPEQKMGGSYNYLTYVMFDNVFWQGISGQVNRWRKRDLLLSSTTLDKLQQTRVPFLYNVSPNVLVPPVDFSSWVRVTGYWFLDEGQENYEPPADLVKFIEKARADNAKIVYIGFGSIVVSNPKELTQAVVASVLKAGVRCVLSKGWSDRLGREDASVPEIELPPEIFKIDAAPHDWLFPRMDAAVHHGGSGTTGASLRAGLPTIIKPFFGDQFFYAGRVEDLGAGIHLRKLTVGQFSKALWEVTHNDRIIRKASEMGKRIKAEKGVEVAIQTIYSELDYARSLIKITSPKLRNRTFTLPLMSVSRSPSGDQSTEPPRERAKTVSGEKPDEESHSTDGSWTLVDSDK